MTENNPWVPAMPPTGYCKNSSCPSGNHTIRKYISFKSFPTKPIETEREQDRYFQPTAPSEFKGNLLTYSEAGLGKRRRSEG